VGRVLITLLTWLSESTQDAIFRSEAKKGKPPSSYCRSQDMMPGSLGLAPHERTRRWRDAAARGRA
jgi:hypothetical protein